jgi:hypothetical protein
VVKIHKEVEKMGIKIIPELYSQLPANPVEMLVLSFDSQERIAEFCGVTPQAVYNWKVRDAIPKQYADQLSQFSGIPTWMLCPRFFEKGESDVAVQSVSQGGRGSGEDESPDSGRKVLSPWVR